MIVLFTFSLTQNYNRLLSLKIYYFLLIFLFLFVGFRYEVGCDWIGYRINYDNAEIGYFKSLQTYDETLWWLSIFFLKHYELPYPIINVFASFIFFQGVHILAKRQPDHLSFLSLLFPVLIVDISMSGIRQAIAIGLLCIALVYYLDRKPLKFLILVLIATSFHNSAILGTLLLPPALDLSTRWRSVLIALAFIPTAYIISQSAGVEIAISRYIEKDINAAGAIFRVGFLALTGVYFLAFLKNEWKRRFPYDFTMVLIASISMIGLLTLLPLSTVIADRISYYFIPLQAVIFARIPYLNLGRSQNFNIMLPYIALTVFFVVWTLSSFQFNQCYLPYQSWLFGFPGESL